MKQMINTNSYCETLLITKYVCRAVSILHLYLSKVLYLYTPSSVVYFDILIFVYYNKSIVSRSVVIIIVAKCLQKKYKF